EPEILLGASRGSISAGRCGGDQIAAARDEASTDRLRYRDHRVLSGKVVRVVILDDDPDRVLGRAGYRVDGKGDTFECRAGRTVTRVDQTDGQIGGAKDGVAVAAVDEGYRGVANVSPVRVGGGGGRVLDRRSESDRRAAAGYRRCEHEEVAGVR